MGCAERVEGTDQGDAATLGDAPPSAETETVCGVATATLTLGDAVIDHGLASFFTELRGGCRNDRAQDGIVRVRAARAGRWIVRASGASRISLSVREGCEADTRHGVCAAPPGTRDPSLWRLARDPDAVVLALDAGQEQLVAVNGCTPGNACFWRLRIAPAPNDRGPCDGPRDCARGTVCQQLAEDHPAAPRRCVVASPPQIVAAAATQRDGLSQFQFDVYDVNMDAVSAAVTFFDLDGRALNADPERVSLAPGALRHHHQSPWQARGTLGAVLIGVQDAEGLTHEARVAVGAVPRVGLGQLCDPSRQRAVCEPGLCCWSHEGTVGVCRSSCR